MAAVTAALALVQAKALSLADASANIGDAVENPASVTETVKQLDSGDKTAYLAKVNAAIDKMPGTAEEKASKYLAVASAAMKGMKGASKEETLAMLAEVYATVPPEALTVVNENFAQTLFSRADGKTSDEAMKQISLDAMKAIEARTAGGDNAAVRDGFAALMFIRASGGSPADLRQSLVDALPTQEAREAAAAEWFPAALGEGREKSYEPMLAVANSDVAPNLDDMIALSYDSIFAESLLADLASTVGEGGVPGGVFSDMYADAGLGGSPYSTVEKGLYNVPRTVNPGVPWNSDYRRGGGKKGSEPVRQEYDENGGGGEGGGYAAQR